MGLQGRTTKRPVARSGRTTQRRPSRGGPILGHKRGKPRWRLTAVVVAATVAVVVFASQSGDEESELAIPAGSTCTFDERSDPGRRHGSGFTYAVDPPSGGNHAPVWVEPRRYRLGDPAPPDVELVHSLEHGYVVVWHQADLGAEGSEVLNRLRRAYPRDILVVPRASLDVPVAASAWHRRLLCGKSEEHMLDQFIKAYRNRGPEKYRH